jgi:methyl-accepting chemotaxis protein
MDFDSAIQAHTNWKLRLFSACKGSSKEKIDARTVEKDNVCELGKWLHGDAQKNVGSPALETLLQAHAAFHRTAAGLAVMIERGPNSAAETALNSPGSEFNKLSRQVVGQLAGLRDQH